MSRGFGTNKTPRKRKTKPAKLQYEFLILMGQDSRKAAELLVKHDIPLPIRKTIDINWYSVDEVEAWINSEMPEIDDAVEKAKLQLRTEGC